MFKYKKNKRIRKENEILLTCVMQSKYRDYYYHKDKQSFLHFTSIFFSFFFALPLFILFLNTRKWQPRNWNAVSVTISDDEQGNYA